MIKKETGKKREFSTGAKKQAASGKGTPVLFPGDAYLDISKHFEDGAETYEARNWEAGIPLSELVNSLERHIAQFKMNMTDESHLRAIAWNAVVLLATKLRIENGLLPGGLDDMPKYGTSISISDILKERRAAASKNCDKEINKHCNQILEGTTPGFIDAKELTEELGLGNDMLKKLLGPKEVENIMYCRDCIHHIPNGTACLQGIILSGEDQEVGTCSHFERNHKKMVHYGFYNSSEPPLDSLFKIACGLFAIDVDYTILKNKVTCKDCKQTEIYRGK